MRDIIMDSFKLGLGAIDLTREQAAKLVDRIEAMYPDEVKDGRRMVDDLVAAAEENAGRVRKRIEEEVAKAVKEQRLVPQEDLKELAANVKELAKSVAKVSKQAAKNATTCAKRLGKSVAKRSAPKKGVQKKGAAKRAAKRPAKPAKAATAAGKPKPRRR